MKLCGCELLQITSDSRTARKNYDSFCIRSNKASIRIRGQYDKVIHRLRTVKAPASWIDMVQEVTQLDEADEQRIFGEFLPPGLRLMT